jgi:hypothetical protein
MNPNERKYYDKKKGCTLNARCKACLKKIWVQEGVQTMYEGKQYISNNAPYTVMSVAGMDGVYCPKCYENRNKEVK